MAGLLVIILSSLSILFVWAPMGVFVWFGLPNEAILFKEGYRYLSATVLAVFYVGNGALLLQLPRIRRKWAVGLFILGLWLFGLWGFFNAFGSVVAPFER